MRDERPRNATSEFHSRDVPPQPSASFLPPLLAYSFLCSRAADEDEWETRGRFSSRRDDECCNVRLEARNSMVRSARVVYAVYTTMLRNCPKARVYEISRLRCRVRRVALARECWIYLRSISHDFLPVNLRPLAAQHVSRVSSRRGGENLHALRPESAATSSANSGKNPLLSHSSRCERTSQSRRRLMLIPRETSVIKLSVLSKE